MWIISRRFRKSNMSDFIWNIKSVLGIVAFIGLYLGGLYYNNYKFTEYYNEVYNTGITEQQVKVSMRRRAGLDLVLNDGTKYVIYPDNITEYNFKQYIDNHYKLSKYANSSKIYLEKNGHKVSVTLLKPRKHWYDI